MNKIVLPNGLTVIYKKRPGKSVVVEMMIKVGSNSEDPKERGIAHFLEHMLFEGTKKRPSNRRIANEIESIGGDFNAYTSHEKTCFYVKVLNKHFKRAVDVLSDIITNPLLRESEFEKEKKVVLREIEMINDEPRMYQWILLQENLFSKHPTRLPVFGNPKVIKNLTRKQVENYMKKYYKPSNMVLAIVGDVNNWKPIVKEYFTLKNPGKIYRKNISEPKSNRNKIKRKKIPNVNTYLALGFKSVPRGHKDSYVLDVIDAILGRGQSGKLFTEIRSRRGLAYEVGSEYVNDCSYGFFATYACVKKKDVLEVKKLIINEIKKLEDVTDKDVIEAKQFIEGEYLMDLEEGQKVADQLLFWELVNDGKLMNSYIKEIKKITVKDVKRVIKKYFKNYTMTILEGK